MRHTIKDFRRVGLLVTLVLGLASLAQAESKGDSLLKQLHLVII